MTGKRLFRNVASICCLTAVLTVALPAGLAHAGQATRASGTLVTKQAAARQAAAAKQKQASTTRSAAARRAAAAAPAPSRALTPRYKFDESGAIVPDIRAAAAIVYNPQSGEVLWESNSQTQRSIASLTKMMTAIIVFESGAELSETVVIQTSDVRNASTTYLRSGDRVTRQDLMHLLLIASDNAAARALARSSEYGAAGFVDRMNEKAEELGLSSTTYADPSGLLAANLSSAYDIARLIAYVSGDERIAGIMRKQTYSATASRRKISIHSTNQLVRQGDVDVQAGKTGFIRKAGYCLATLLQLPQGGPQVAVVVLGAQSSAVRFAETRHLFNWMASKAQDLLGTPLEAASVGN